MDSYARRLHASIRAKRTPACVGLDPRLEQLPESIRQFVERGAGPLPVRMADAYRQFCCEVIDAVAPLVPVVKPQSAFFEELGPAGCAALADVMQHARHRGLMVICDAKRGDIGSTAQAYARGYLAGAAAEDVGWPADALTVNPYLGRDTLQPFVEVACERGAGVYVLVRTSNPEAGTFQDLSADGEPLYDHVARMVEDLAVQTSQGERFGCIGAVVGATYPEELGQLRDRMPHAPLLVPGYGSQGGTAADVAQAFQPDGLGAVVNSSRGVIFAYLRPPYNVEFGHRRWQDAVAAAAREMVADLAEHTSAGVLRGSTASDRSG
jgi:orotidine-5'-phosphate decarboxylase